MRRLIYFISMTILLQSCANEASEPVVPALKNTDRVDIVFYNGGDSLFFNTTDPKGIQILTTMLSGKENNKNDACVPSGEFRYMVKEQQIYTAQFAFASKEADNCSYVRYSWQNKTFKHALTERAENLLRQIQTSTANAP